MKGIMEMQPEKNFYPNANSMMRLTYGKVGGYEMKDAVTARMGRSDSTQGDLLNKVKGKKGPPKFKGWSRLKLVELDAENVAPPVYLDD